MIRRTDSGYVLLTLLVLLLGVGGGWMSLGAGARPQGHVLNAVSERDRHGLVQARQALLSYAALYPYLYGPTGAGPAHLPCPDSDGDRQSGYNSAPAFNQRRDGPNPPCSSLIASSGMLPRHTLLPGYRYLFHAEPWQRFEYRVAGNIVNNPLNRLINLHVLHTLSRKPVASISLPSLDSDRTQVEVLITGKALIEPTSASVAAWVLWRSTQNVQGVCTLSNDSTTDSLPVTGVSTHKPCHPIGSTSAPCEHDEVLTLVLDRPLVRSGKCLGNSLQLNTIEGVSALRHWFVRNRWHQSLTLSYRDACDSGQPSVSLCQLFVAAQWRVAIRQPGAFIEFYWGMPL